MSFNETGNMMPTDETGNFCDLAQIGMNLSQTWGIIRGKIGDL
jgi:hypothetical protein